MRAVHIGDLHFWTIPLHPAEYMGKRVLGVGNLVWKRRRQFELSAAPLLVERVNALDPGVILFSGDFSTTALRAEFRRAFEALAPLTRPGRRIFAVPGNHDRYTRREIQRRTMERTLAPLAPGLLPLDPAVFSFAEVLQPGLGLFAIDAGTSNGLGSHGRVSPAVVEHLRQWLAANPVEELWLLCHFPAEEPAELVRHPRGPQLLDAEPLLEALEGVPSVLFLHGHHHARWIFPSPTRPNLRYLNAGAPLLRHHRLPADLGFHLLERSQSGDTHLTMHTCDRAIGQWHECSMTIPTRGAAVDLQRPAVSG